MNALPGLTIRTQLTPGDLGSIVHLHGTLYVREYGFDHTFEAYVAGPLAQFSIRASPRERIWIAEQERRIVGCIAIVDASDEPTTAGTARPDVAQLRWFLVDPSARGHGLGRLLLLEAVAFCEEQGYGRIILWTVSALTAAANLYRQAGFAKIEDKPGGFGAWMWSRKSTSCV
jgi:GNAT superfamily N-acetyltransferase